jgi:hypothetical protein
MRLPAFIVNIVAFSACACLAFARNINALFYHFDGSYAFVDAREQLQHGQPVFEYTNNFLQSIGNIQLPMNANLLFFYWPIDWFSDLPVIKIACYVAIAATVFASTYALARMLSLPRRIGLIAGWIVGFTACPFVALWYFYPILYVGPPFLLVLVAPVLAFWLIDRDRTRRPARRRSMDDRSSYVGGLFRIGCYVSAAGNSARDDPICCHGNRLGAKPY